MRKAYPRPLYWEQLGLADDVGIMVTDRGRNDDANVFDNVRQHKCLAHVQQSLSEGLAAKTGRGRDFGEQFKGLLQDALRLSHDGHDGPVTDVAPETKGQREVRPDQLRDRPLKDRDTQQ